MMIRALIDRVDRSRRLVRRVSKDANARRYTRGMDDFFSVPLGYVDPNQRPDDDDRVSLSPIPPEAFEHRGKWLALRRRKILAVRDTRAELREEFGHRRTEVVFFYVRPAAIYVL